MTPSHAVVVLLDDDILTVNRVIGVVRRRNLPIDGLSVGPGEGASVLRLTLLIQADAAAAERMLRQLEKTHGVRSVAVFPAAEAVTREVTLIKVRSAPNDGAALRAVVKQFGGAVADERQGGVIVEIGGARENTQALLAALEPFGIVEVARSGAVALRGADASDSITHPSEAVL